MSDGPAAPPRSTPPASTVGDAERTAFAGGLRHCLDPQALWPGHKLRVLAGGGEAYPEMLAAIGAAEREIDLETYIWRNDGAGRRFAAALAEKARAAVAVRVVVDGAGSFGLGPDVWNLLVEAGAQVRVFHPVGPWRARWGWSVRDHRKLLVVDGRVAFAGGLNLGDEYAPREEPWRGKGWRDVHLRVEGPAVAHLQRLFQDAFRHAAPGGGAKRVRSSSPDLGGGARVQVLAVGRRGERGLIQRHYLFAVATARRAVWIENAYFIPNRRWRRALALVARRGVDVRVIVPRDSDVPGLRWASRHTWAPLLRSGVRIFEYRPAMLHAKTLLVDGEWAAVGSYNLDQRSLRYNWEVALEMVDASACSSLRDLFLRDQRESEPVDRKRFGERSSIDRMRENLFYHFRVWL